MNSSRSKIDTPRAYHLLHDRLSVQGVQRQRFLREAKLASRLDHPYAAHVYGFGVEEADGLLWIAMEFVHGITLKHWLRDREPMPFEQFVAFFENLAEVVQTAHDLGIVHRDLKPSNVMVIERAGRMLPKLLDLGVAKLRDGERLLESPPEILKQLRALRATARCLPSAAAFPRRSTACFSARPRSRSWPRSRDARQARSGAEHLTLRAMSSPHAAGPKTRQPRLVRARICHDGSNRQVDHDVPGARCGRAGTRRCPPRCRRLGEAPTVQRCARDVLGYAREVRVLFTLGIAFTGCGFRASTTVGQDANERAPDANGDARLDAGIDAPVTCPMTTPWQTVSGQASSYRIEPSLVTWYVARQSCETAFGFHLAVYETQQEAIDVRSLYTSGQIYWIGMIQPTGQSTLGGGWKWITGPDGLSNWEPSEPNDVDNTEDNTEQFAVALLPQGKFRDTDGPMPHSYICECDGKALDPGVIATIP